jgi:GNAT superfamily N-acetyltransferase
MQEIRLQVEKLSPENFDHFVALLTRSRGLDKTRHSDIAILERLKEDAFSVNPKYEAYLGKIGVDWVTYVTVTKSYSTSSGLPGLSIDDLYVLDGFRDLGIGAAMFEYAVRKAKKRGCGRIDLDVPTRNKKARKFFEFNGAVAIDSTRYTMDLSDIKVGKPRGRMTFADFIRKRQAQISRLRARQDNDQQLLV